MRIGLRSWMVFALAVATAGNASAQDDMRATGTIPQTPLAFFDGKARSTGTVTTLFVSTNPFTATFEGTYDNGDLKLDERFTFEDGEALQRWDLFAHRDGSISGTVTTELENGTMAPTRRVTGEYSQTEVTIDYDGYAPNGSDTLFHFHHVMRPQPDGTVSNDVTISKFYLPLATSDVTFIKPNRR